MLIVRWRAIAPGNGYEKKNRDGFWSEIPREEIDAHLDNGGIVSWQPPAGLETR